LKQVTENRMLKIKP